ncbi:translation initiation factor IF-2 [bacterium]|nr:translation initiation factor IF-2 [bacterium]
MAKIRIYEIAKKLDIPSKDMVKKLNELGFSVKSPLNVVDQETADRIVSLIQRGKTTPKKKIAKASAKQVSKRKRSSDKATAATLNETTTINVAGRIRLCQLARFLGLKTKVLVRELQQTGKAVSQDDELSIEQAQEIALEHGFSVEEVPLELEDMSVSCKELEKVELRPPIVTVLGHVDHGKTSLLDFIRKAHVAEREDGGITQHIGAYQVATKCGKVTFIDTPGHEAFSAMRARGAMVTDIVVLVVAADDGVMPQTKEAINHARAAEVPIIVAINKIDKPNADPQRVRNELIKYDLLSEDLGGETIVVDISAKKGTGVDNLLEMILLQAEMMELQANPNLPARGTIIEAQLDKGRGPIATVLIERGTLKVGDAFVVGNHCGKVRALIDDAGQRYNQVGPSFPVEVDGLSGVPVPGDALIVVTNEKKAKQLSEERIQECFKRETGGKRKATLEELFEQMQESSKKELKVVVKTDVQGSCEAIRDALNKFKSDKIEIQILHEGVGTITDADIHLAATSSAIIIGYRIKPAQSTKTLAQHMNVEIRLYKIIYELIEDIEKILLGLLEPQFKDIELGTAEVREIFLIPKVGSIAGCFVLTGKIQNNALVRLVRDNILVYDGRIESLRHFKDDVKEVVSGQECGIRLVNYLDIKVNDIIEAYRKEEIEVSL